MEPPGQKPLIVNGAFVSPVEEEEEGIGIASDVVMVEGENHPRLSEGGQIVGSCPLGS